MTNFIPRLKRIETVSYPTTDGLICTPEGYDLAYDPVLISVDKTCWDTISSGYQLPSFHVDLLQYLINPA